LPLPAVASSIVAIRYNAVLHACLLRAYLPMMMMILCVGVRFAGASVSVVWLAVARSRVECMALGSRWSAINPLSLSLPTVPAIAVRFGPDSVSSRVKSMLSKPIKPRWYPPNVRAVRERSTIIRSWLEVGRSWNSKQANKQACSVLRWNSGISVRFGPRSLLAARKCVLDQC